MTDHIIRERRTEIREESYTQGADVEERRTYTRVTHIRSDVRLMTCDQAVKVLPVPVINITQGGMLVRSLEPIQCGTLVALRWPDESIAELIDVRVLLCENDGSMLGRVVRLSMNDDKSYEVAIEFLKKGI